MQPKKFGAFPDLLKRSLRTGSYPGQPGGAAAYDHGGLIGPGMHKDVFYRTLYADAREAAVRAAAWYVELYARNAQTLAEWKQVKAAIQ